MTNGAPQFTLKSALLFILASAAGWGALWLLVFRLLSVFAIPDTSGEEFAFYIRDNFLSLFGMFCFGSFGAAIRMHFEADFSDGKLVLNDGTDAFGRMSIGGFFGIMAFAALDAGLLSVLVTGTNVQASITAQLVMSFGFGLYAAEIFKRAGKRFVQDNKTDGGDTPDQTDQGNSN